MKRKNVTRNALITSIISMLLCVSMLVGTTFAWFTDSVTSTNNTITAGNLDIDLEYSLTGADGTWNPVSATTELFKDDTLWEPGHTEVVYLKITNKGTLALNYKIGLNVVDEKSGTNVAGKSFNLSEHIKFDVVDSVEYDREAVRAAALNGKPIHDTIENPAYDTGSLLKGATMEKALVVYMPETVGNEANYRGTAPYIKLGLNLVASQKSEESDSFGADYDAGKENEVYPQGGTGTAAVPAEGVANVPVTVRNSSNNAKVATMDIPAAALAEGVENVEVTVTPTTQDANVTVADDQDAKSFDIDVKGIKEGNTEPIKVELRVGTGLTGVKVYHKENEITDRVVYNATTGYVTFYTTSFSPYTVVYDAVPVEEDENTLDKTVPVATVTDADECENVVLGWAGWGGYNPTAGAEQMLESVYLFESPHNSESVKKNFYKNWYCDYYVKFVPAEGSDMTKLPEGTITLGGNYGGYGWVGFDNPTVDVNTFIPLLGSVLGDCDETGVMVDTGWTYESVVGLVEKFWCGVAKANGSTADIDGAKFVVELRLTNPENFNDYIAVNTVTYTFGIGESVIDIYQGQ